jgi:hypothetical protein
MDQENAPAGNAPYAIAMVVCDFIWRDPGTGKSTIIGTFSSIAANSFPCTHPLMAVFVAVTDGRGKTPIKLRLVDVDEENDPLFEGEIEVEWVDPRMIVETAYVIQGVAFPAPGEYRFQLSSNDSVLMERRIVLIDTKQHKEE